MVALTFFSLSYLALYSTKTRMKMALSESSSSSTTEAAGSTVVGATATIKRLPTFRSISSTISSRSDATESSSKSAQEQIKERTDAMNLRAKEGSPFTGEEIEGVVESLQHVFPEDTKIDFSALRKLLNEVAHLSHKDWNVTGKNAVKLGVALELAQGVSKTAHARQLLERILRDGNWHGAENRVASDSTNDVTTHVSDANTAKTSSSKSWAVLVTGVNGIRKTTSMYQPWFADLLRQAIILPTTHPVKEEGKSSSDESTLKTEDLPSGSNSFFRQLDHMIATLCNKEFAILYQLTSKVLDELNINWKDSKSVIPVSVVQLYSDLKAAIFTRYRTLSELLGVVLLRDASHQSLNCLMETSGRDVAMFHYVDHFFADTPDSPSYNKLALHFTINDLSHAKTSVDSRMVEEIKAGIEALNSDDAFAIIDANAGGPYGSDVLDGVQEASDRVWNEVVLKNDGVGEDWYKATIQINADASKAWTAQAVQADGTLGTVHSFEKR